MPSRQTTPHTRLLQLYGAAIGLCIASTLFADSGANPEPVLAVQILLVLLLLPSIFAAGYSVHGRLTIRKAYRVMFDCMIDTVVNGGRFVIVDLRHCPGVNRRRFRTRTRKAESFGAIHLGDVEDLRYQFANRRTHCYERIMTLDDGRILLSLTQIRYRPLTRLFLWLSGREGELYPLDLHSRLSTGRIVRTTTFSSWAWEPNGIVHQRCCTQGESLKEMIELHRGDLARLLIADPSAELQQFTTINDAIASEQELIALAGQVIRQQGILSETHVAHYCSALPTRIARIFREELLAARSRSGFQPPPPSPELVKPDYQSRS